MAWQTSGSSLFCIKYLAERGSSDGCVSAWFSDSLGFDPHVWQHSLVEICHEIISTAILSLPLIQEGQLSVTGKLPKRLIFLL